MPPLTHLTYDSKQLEAAIRANYNGDIDAELRRLVEVGRRNQLRGRGSTHHRAMWLMEKLRKEGIAKP